MSKISNCFEQAKAFIVVPEELGFFRYGREKYICCAIVATRCSDAVKARCRGIIESQLGNEESLESWLRMHHGSAYYTPYILDPKIQQTRINWLNSLIKEFK